MSDSFSFMNLSNSSEMNCGPLLETSCSGNPYLANILRSTSNVFSVVVVDIGTTSNHLNEHLQ